jgi:hypothetical protein
MEARTGYVINCKSINRQEDSWKDQFYSPYRNRRDELIRRVIGEDLKETGSVYEPFSVDIPLGLRVKYFGGDFIIISR